MFEDHPTFRPASFDAAAEVEVGQLPNTLADVEVDAREVDAREVDAREVDAREVDAREVQGEAGGDVTDASVSVGTSTTDESSDMPALAGLVAAVRANAVLLAATQADQLRLVAQLADVEAGEA